MDAEVAPGARMSDFEIEVQLLLDAIYLKYHYDFRGYALASLKRRLRTALDRFGCTTLSQLQDRVLRDATAFAGTVKLTTRSSLKVSNPKRREVSAASLARPLPCHGADSRRRAGR